MLFIHMCIFNVHKLIFIFILLITNENIFSEILISIQIVNIIWLPAEMMDIPNFGI